jgi:preprotein translocase subunit SecD
MKTLPELLRDADPVGYEPPRSTRDRHNSRRRILDAPPTVAQRPGRRGAIAAIATFSLLAIAGGFRYWSLGTVDVIAAVRFEVRLAEENPAPGLRQAVVAGSSRTIYLHPETVVTNGDIARAQAKEDAAPGTYSVVVTFSDEGAARMLRASRDHIDRPVAILVDGVVVSAPVVRSAISKAAVIGGNYTKAEADTIVAGLLGI